MKLRDRLFRALCSLGCRPKLRPGDQIITRPDGASGQKKLGTLGALVERNGHIYALSCELMVASPTRPLSAGLDVRTRSSDPSATKQRASALGTVNEIGGIDFTRAHSSMDAALIALRRPRRSAPEPHKLGPVSAELVSLEQACEGEFRVTYFGAKSGDRAGTVMGFAKVTIDELTPHPYRVDVLVIEADPQHPFLCDEGDSGSVLWEASRSPRRAVGLLVSMTNMHTGYAIPIGRVLTHFNAKIVCSNQH